MSLLNSSPQSLSPEVPDQPILCYVTDRRSLPVGSEEARLELLLRKIESLCAAGIDWIQIREKDLSGNACAGLVRNAASRIAAGARPANRNTRLLVNERLDVALAENAGGVHLGEQALPMAEARRLVLSNPNTRSASPGFLTGASCHSLAAAQAAAAEGADYIFFGPVFVTPSKAAFGAPQGTDRLHEVCRSVSIPVLAIGGITLENAASCLTAGARGIAAIRLFQDAPDPARVVRELRNFSGY